MKKTKEIGNKLYSHSLVFIKFCLVGGATMAIYFLFIWFVESFVGLSYLIAVSMAYFFSVLFHFLASKYFTFSTATRGYSKSLLVRYLFLLLINYLITMFVVSFFVEQLQLSPYIAVCVSAVFTILTGYLLSRYWVFKIKKEII
ncbi:GtrA-like protein [Yersinia enterocolitica]|uniref:GtrA family protein n=1 Tax=Yersinia mollaretii TaxID=33060 RepID=UPI0005DC4D9A|nr:GtrA-like protein [Yersinia enterocolitica]